MAWKWVHPWTEIRSWIQSHWCTIIQKYSKFEKAYRIHGILCLDAHCQPSTVHRMHWKDAPEFDHIRSLSQVWAQFYSGFTFQYWIIVKNGLFTSTQSMFATAA